MKNLFEYAPPRQRAPGVEKDPYLYHATLARNVEGIVDSGFVLLPSKNPNWGGTLGSGSIGKVFFSLTKDGAEYYGNILRRDLGDPGEFLVILRVDKKEVFNFTTDPEDFNSVYTKNRVVVGNASVWDGSEWRPFADVADSISEGEWDDIDPELFDETEEFDPKEKEVHKPALERLGDLLEEEKWMQKAVDPSKKGALRDLASKEGGLNDDGTIRRSWLAKKKNTGSTKTKQRVNFALRAREANK